ncbi:aminoglycoside phosphotransferase family protein [Nocardioides coralli]|uniref:phosphotransferase n=1 Tax=Nocardioides coralli TaxID=2872154 RepID=UPI001CA457D8|nr:aminoglycoside phosphotransferase family protein [Nocardioides coralli]QZY30413.1 aminoglycoside phosphotransferase family protein [Nocardioides coralli]
MSGWHLVDGDVTVVDGLVLRPERPWTAAVHALLAHLRAQGLTCVPEPVGVRDGVEAVTYLEGDAGQSAFRHQYDESGLRSAAVLLRAVHDAATGFVAPDPSVWSFPPVPGATTVCHGDPGPWNFVWRDGEAVGLIDWDHASPAPVVQDVAYALDTFAPFRPDEVVLTEHGFPEAPDRAARVRAFASAYGLEDTTGIVDRVIERQQQTVERVLSLADRRIEPWAAWVRAGYLGDLQGRARWTRSHRHLVE